MFDVKRQNEETHFVGTAFSVIVFHLTNCYFIWLLSDCGCLSWLVRPWDNGPWKYLRGLPFLGEIPDTTFPLVQDSTYNILGSEKNNLRKERLTALDFYWEFDVLFFLAYENTFWLPWLHTICWFSWVLSWSTCMKKVGIYTLVALLDWQVDSQTTNLFIFRGATWAACLTHWKINMDSKDG